MSVIGSSHSQEGPSPSSGLVIFGYGSLIWRPDFAFEASYDGVVKGHVRRFWQRSPDHRGTADAPGRVATLVPAYSDEDCEVSGTVFLLSPAVARDVVPQLEHREQAGYSWAPVDVRSVGLVTCWAARRHVCCVCDVLLCSSAICVKCALTRPPRTRTHLASAGVLCRRRGPASAHIYRLAAQRLVGRPGAAARQQPGCRRR